MATRSVVGRDRGHRLGQQRIHQPDQFGATKRRGSGNNSRSQGTPPKHDVHDHGRMVNQSGPSCRPMPGCRTPPPPQLLVSAFPVSMIQSFASRPTFDIQFGGVGSPHAALPAFTEPDLDGYITPVTFHPASAIELRLGRVRDRARPRLRIQRVSDGLGVGQGGQGLVLGTPVVSGGVTSYTVTGQGSGYTTPVGPFAPPIVVVDPSSISITGTLTVGVERRSLEHRAQHDRPLPRDDRPEAAARRPTRSRRSSMQDQRPSRSTRPRL